MKNEVHSTANDVTSLIINNFLITEISKNNPERMALLQALLQSYTRSSASNQNEIPVPGEETTFSATTSPLQTILFYYALEQERRTGERLSQGDAETK